jgi:hypothetical protein
MQPLLFSSDTQENVIVGYLELGYDHFLPHRRDIQIQKN